MTDPDATRSDTDAMTGGESAARTVTAAELALPADLARATELTAERKAREPVLLDLRGLSDATDYFLIVSGTSDLHVRAVAEHVIEELKKEGHRPSHVEGLRGGRWALIDYIDFVVHVFHPAARDFYQLERLWGDAPLHLLEAD
jgi:ribosome-associated protein